jgi:hypothetical protein
MQYNYSRSHTNFSLARAISLSRANSPSPTKGKGPFSATLSPTINGNRLTQSTVVRGFGEKSGHGLTALAARLPPV